AKKLTELRDELMHERGVAAMGGAPPNPGKIRALRKNIARILTIMREEELAGGPGTPGKTPAAKPAPAGDETWWGTPGKTSPPALRGESVARSHRSRQQ